MLSSPQRTLAPIPDGAQFNHDPNQEVMMHVFVAMYLSLPKISGGTVTLVAL